MSISRMSRGGDRRLDVYAQAEQHQSRHNERSRDHRDKRPYIGSDGPDGFVGRVAVKSIHELAFARSPTSRVDPDQLI
jgi:hypothetical protein